MKRLLLVVILASCWVSEGLSKGIEEDHIEFGPFGPLTVYSQSSQPSHVVLFVSGDGGWNLGVIEMARELTSLDAMVVGIDIVRYLKHLESQSEGCSYPAADFEMLSKFVQKKLNYPRYVNPVLVGYSSGATLVYAVLAQSPPNTFRGAISMGFCPDLLLPKPLCRGSGLKWEKGPKNIGFIFSPATHLHEPWIALQGTIDEVCYPKVTEEFVKRVNTGRLVLLPKVGHGFSVPRNWLLQFRDEFQRLVAQSNRQPSSVMADLQDLPLVEVPADAPSKDAMAVILSGDGGWAGIDREVAGVLAKRGIAVVGLNSLKYFWAKKTPEIAAEDLNRILRAYLTTWKKDRVILVGYSLGADVLPFMANRIDSDLLNRVVLIALLGPGNDANFEFHLTDWLGGKSQNSLPVLPETEKLANKHLLCIYGEEEKESLCSRLSVNQARLVPFKGAHHFGGSYETIANLIVEEEERASGATNPQRTIKN
jgi:type IV secretory pathway VirJ component